MPCFAIAKGVECEFIGAVDRVTLSRATLRGLLMKCLLLPILLVGSIIISTGVAAFGQEVGHVKDAARNHPGWTCPHHPDLKTFTPNVCPICRQMGKGFIFYVRNGEWTCEDHPEVSSVRSGKCPFCSKYLITVREFEKRTGESIATFDKLTNEALAKVEEERMRVEELSRKQQAVELAARAKKVASAGPDSAPRQASPLWVVVLGILIVCIVGLGALFVFQKWKRGKNRPRV